MADHRDAAQAEQNRATGGIGIHLAPQAAQGRAQHQATEHRHRIRARRAGNRARD
jgi:hypothetical protein